MISQLKESAAIHPQVLRDYDNQPTLILPVKLSAIVEGERKTVHNINYLKNNHNQQTKPKPNKRLQKEILEHNY